MRIGNQRIFIAPDMATVFVHMLALGKRLWAYCSNPLAIGRMSKTMRVKWLILEVVIKLI
jgi:hypothetical protein